MPQAVETDAFPRSDAALQREILRNRKILFREEAARAKRMAMRRELHAREAAALRAAQRRHLYWSAGIWLVILLAGTAAALVALPDVIDWMRGFSWFPRR